MELKSFYIVGTLLAINLFTKNVESLGGIGFSVIRQTLQNNIAGTPIVHEKTEWNYDPDNGIKQRHIFYERHGYRAAKFIESIGVGIDGKEEERRAEQADRDVGRLNGDHYINFP